MEPDGLDEPALIKQVYGKLTKAEIVDAIYNKVKIERRDIRYLVDLFLEEIKAGLISHKVIELRGFGTFEIKVRKGREKARNPKTGVIRPVHRHGIAIFRAGRELKKEVWSLNREEQVVTDERTIDREEGT